MVAEYSAREMNTDAPVTTKDEDHLGRWALARGVANEISRRHDYGITIGLYAPWGSGKTTFLKFVEANLKELGAESPVWLNGWLGHNWEISAQILFKKIFEMLDEDYASWKNRLAQKLHSLVDSVPLKLKLTEPFAGLTGELDASGTKTFLSQLAQVDLVEIRDKLNKNPKTSSIVVFVDDVDRQEASEIRELFRLLRFFSEIPVLNFVVAMDPDIVAPALKQVYQADGHHVLDKFVQIPIRLPPPKANMLLGLLDEGLNSVLERHEASLSEHEQELLQKGVYAILLKTLKTPRQIQLMNNIFALSLELLGSEVNKADLIFMASLSVAQPSLVKAIHAHRNLLLGNNLSFLDLMSHPDDDNAHLNAILKAFNREWGDIEGEDVLEILKILFPQIKGLFTSGISKKANYSHYEIGNRSLRRLCDDDFFFRFFELSVPENELKEIEIESFVTKVCSGCEAKDFFDDFLRLLSTDSYRLFLGLENYVDVIGRSENSVALGLMIASSAKMLSQDNKKPHPFPGILSPWHAAGRVVAKLCFYDGKVRAEKLTLLVRHSKPVNFALEWCHDARKMLGDDDLFWAWFNKAIAQSIEEENLLSGELVFHRYPGRVVVLLDLWIRGTDDAGKVTGHFGGFLKKEPPLLLDFLYLYVSHAKPLGGGKRTSIDDLSETEFRRLSQFLDKSTLCSCLRWFSHNLDYLSNLTKQAQTLLYQFIQFQLEKNPFVWSSRSKKGIYHDQDCPKAKLIKNPNRVSGKPTADMTPHLCISNDEASLLDSLDKILVPLSQVKDISQQDW